jgi:NADH dehydrogenase FAD-containing subunit
MSSFSAFGYRVGIDEWLRIPSAHDVFAVGDCSGFLESTGKPVLPALAQVRYFFQGIFVVEIFIK